ncbi:MAG: DUF167 domain-containing protein [Sporomusaceae bacterium]|nr:DUF167 domain-containing protein [Sporomusaceae bacterium]
MKTAPDEVVLTVKVQPRSSRNRIVRDPLDNSIKVYLNAPPVDGAANQACIALIAAWLRVPKSSVSLLAGQKSRIKTVKINGISASVIEMAVNSYDKN